MKTLRPFMLVALVLLLGACAKSSATPTATATPLPPTESPPTATPLPPTEPPPTETPLPPIEPPPTETPPPTPRPTREPTRTPIAFQVFENIQYGATENHMLDVYQPQMEQSVPTLLLFPGPGYLKMYMVDIADFFVRRGYAVLAINRTLLQYPHSEQDSFCALAWAHANAETYNFDPQRIVPVGFSIGGALAAFLGTVDDAGKYLASCPNTLPEEDYVGGVATVAGFFDYTIYISGAEEGGLISYFGPPAQNMERIREVSAVNWVDGSEPPFLLIHGENDTNVDPNQSIEFQAQLSAAGVDAELILMPNLVHDNILTSPQVWLRIAEFVASLSH